MVSEPLVPWSQVVRFIRQHSHDVRNHLNGLALEAAALAEFATDPEAAATIARLRSQIRTSAAEIKALSARVTEPAVVKGRLPAKHVLMIWKEQLDSLTAPPVEWDDQFGEENVELDPALMAIVFRELLSNAGKFAAGKVKVIGRIEDGRAIFEQREARTEPVDDSLSDLKFARFDGAAWNVVTVESTGSVGRYSSLAFGPDGQPAIAYYDATGSGGGGGGTSVKLARFNGNVWTPAIVDTGTLGDHGALAFGPDGQPAISYDGSAGVLKFARFSGTAWNFSIADGVGLVGRYTAIRFAPGGQPAISYWDQTNGNLKFARKGVFQSAP